MAACAPTQATTPDAPTLELIPATATDTPTSVPPTLSPEPLSQPEDLFATPTASALAEETPETLVEVDPIAAELASIAQRLVAQDLDLPTRRVRIVDVQPFVWTDSSLGCPAPGQTYTQIESRGYRIVVNAANEDYLFHTDFVRVLPCNPDHEQLPLEATPETTSEVTQESTAEATADAE